MATFRDEHLGVTSFRDDEGLPTKFYVHKHRSGALTIGIQNNDGRLNISSDLTRDQALWLASALAEATEEVAK